MADESNAGKGPSPGTYTRETLPLPRPEVQKILDRINVVAPLISSVRKQNGEGVDSLAIEDKPRQGIHVTDKAQRAIDPDWLGRALGAKGYEE